MTRARIQSVAVVCPGPSLRDLRVGEINMDQYDRVICVNRAAAFMKCDIWAVQDQDAFDPTIEQLPKGSNPRLLTSCNLHAYASKDNKWRFHWLMTQKLRFDWDQVVPIPWFDFTATNAIVWALFEEWAGLIDIYGCDLRGQDDWDNRQTEKAHKCRNENRWERERKIIQEMLEEYGDLIELRGHYNGSSSSLRGAKGTKNRADR